MNIVLNSSNSKKAIKYFDSSLVLFQKYKMHEDVGKSYQSEFGLILMKIIITKQ